MELGKRDDTPDRSQLFIDLQRRVDTVVITLVGEIDIASVADMTAAIDPVVTDDGVTAVHIDAIHVTFVDSAGLRSLMQARSAAVAHGLLFSLQTERGGQVERVIKLSGLDGRLTDYTPTRT